jgi:hypothetical protein
MQFPVPCIPIPRAIRRVHCRDCPPFSPGRKHQVQYNHKPLVFSAALILLLLFRYSLEFACDNEEPPPLNRHATGTSLTLSPPPDACGVCGGNNATCAGCDGVPNSGKKLDSCGTCGGSDSSCSSSYSVTPLEPLPASGFCPDSLSAWRWTVSAP